MRERSGRTNEARGPRTAFKSASVHADQRGGVRGARAGAARFGRDEGGVVALIFGIALLPAIVLAGGAVDYTRGAQLKTVAQGAADAAALAAARHLGATDAEVDAVVRRVLDANLPEAYRGLPVTWKPLDARSAVRIDFAADMPNYFLGLTSLIAGTDMSTTTVGVTSTARGPDFAEVALVVDVTGSMKAHMPALRRGAGEFVDILFGGAETSDTFSMSLVPYVTTVNVRGADDHMSWMDRAGRARYHGNWFERISHGSGNRELHVSRAPECLEPKAEPAPKSPAKKSPPKKSPPKKDVPGTSEKAPKPKPVRTPPKPTPPKKSPPKKSPPEGPPPVEPPSDIGVLEAPRAPADIWDRLASAAGGALHGGARALGDLLVPSARADAGPTRRQQDDKDAHDRWIAGDQDAWRDMDMTEAFVDCTLRIGEVNHFDLFDAMGVAWRGCVEMRPAPYDTTDARPRRHRPDTLFVPYLWPDEIDRPGSSPAAYGRDISRNSYIDDDAHVPERVLVSRPERASSRWRDDLYRHGAAAQGYLWKYDKASTGSYDPDTGLTTHTAEKINEVRFGKLWNWIEASPNAACPDPIVGLTGERAPLDARIANLRSMGGSGTNMAIGLGWGWRTLSPGAPFTQGKPYGEARNTKIAVLMTDGMNMVTEQARWWTRSDYSSIGYAKEKRLGTENVEEIREIIDEKTLEICRNMKDDHEIEIYTIMFNPGEGRWMDRVRDLLEDCATDESHFVEATSGEALERAFGEIAGRISKLRLTR